MLCKEAMFTPQKGTYMTCVQININNVIYVLVYKQELTDSKEGSKSQGMPAKETTHTTITCSYYEGIFNSTWKTTRSSFT